MLGTKLGSPVFSETPIWRLCSVSETPRPTIGALIIRIGCWGPFYYNDNKEPPKIVYLIIKAPIVNPSRHWMAFKASPLGRIFWARAFRVFRAFLFPDFRV